MVGDLARFLDGVDMRHDDAEPAAVENAGGEPVLPRRHPRDRCDADAERGDRNLHRGVEIHRIVLEVEKQPVIAARLHDRRDVDRAALADADAERQLSGVEAIAGGVAKDGFHDGLSFGGRTAILRRWGAGVIGPEMLRFAAPIR